MKWLFIRRTTSGILTINNHTVSYWILLNWR